MPAATSLLPAAATVPSQTPAFSGWLDRRNGTLCADGVALSQIAVEVGTPFYCYSASVLRQRYTALAAAVSPVGVSVCFAVKANSNLNVLAEFARLGCGMDIVSGGEMERALAAGTPAERIIFSGVGKTRDEIRRALEVGLHQINIESVAELETVAEIAHAMGLRAPVALRVNPDVDAGTHAKITTARKDSKFGIAIGEIPALYARASAMPGLEVLGLAVHIGSQIQSLAPFRRAWSALADLVQELRDAGLTVARLDLGGGLGIGSATEPAPDLEAYARTIAETVGDLGCALNIEPGRWLAAPAGVLVTEVTYLKESSGADFAVIDAAMNDLMRPALYDAHHAAVPIHAPRPGSGPAWRLVGPVCESSDDFGSYPNLGPLEPGDLLVFGSAGAYGATMSSTYNSRPLVPEVMVDDGRFRLIRKRAEMDLFLELEKPSDWMAAANGVNVTE